MSNLVLELQQKAIDEGLMDLDVAAVTLWYEKQAGLDPKVI